MMAVMMKLLPQRKALALHAATVEIEDNAYVFFGASGAGKSTLANQSHELDGKRVLGGDQIYLQLRGSKVIASPCTTTIFGFPRGHKGWCPEEKTVAGLIHLVQNESGWSFRPLDQSTFLEYLLRESIQWPEFCQAPHLLEITSDLSNSTGILRGEMSYRLGQSFWPQLLNISKNSLSNEDNKS